MNERSASQWDPRIFRGRIVDQLEAAGILGGFEGSKARRVLISNSGTARPLECGCACERAGDGGILGTTRRPSYFRSMPVKKRISPLAKPTARRVRPLKRVLVAKKVALRAKPGRKVFNDKSLFGALPGMANWAIPLLKELR